MQVERKKPVEKPTNRKKPNKSKAESISNICETTNNEKKKRETRRRKDKKQEGNKNC